MLNVNAISDRVVDTVPKQKRREKSNRRDVNKNFASYLIEPIRPRLPKSLQPDSVNYNKMFVPFHDHKVIRILV